MGQSQQGTGRVGRAREVTSRWLVETGLPVNVIWMGPYRREHLQVVLEVAQEGHACHSLGQPLHLAEEQHEAVLSRQFLQGLPLPFVLPQQLHFSLCGQEAHQALHEVHR